MKSLGLVILCLMMSIWILGDSAYGEDIEWYTKRALGKMKIEKNYKEFQALKEMPSNGFKLVWEIGNYAWGGFSGIMVLQQEDKFKVYFRNFKRYERASRILDKKESKDFLNRLSKLGIWELPPKVVYSCSDCSSHFLTITDGHREVNSVLYGPFMLQESILKNMDFIRHQEILRTLDQLWEQGWFERNTSIFISILFVIILVGIIILREKGRKAIAIVYAFFQKRKYLF